MRPEAQVSGTGIPESGEIIRVARSLAFHGTFANPFVAGTTGETAHVAPVYPLFCAAYIKAFGTGYLAQIMFGAITVGLFALQLALLPWLANKLRLHSGTGVLAATAGAISAHESLDGGWESYFVGLLLMLAFVATLETKTAARSLAVGLLWGVIILTNPVSVLLLAAWPFVMWHRERFAPRFAALVCAAGLVVVPWIIRDYVRFGAFMFVRDNLGLELTVANNPCANPVFQATEDSGCFNRYHPNSNPAVARQVTAQGEYAFNKQLLRQTVTWIRNNPKRFAVLTAQRAKEFWFPTLRLRWEQPLVWFVTILAFAGLPLLWRSQKRLAAIITVTWVLYPVIYYLVVAEPRYAYPIVWTFLLPAGVAVKAVAERLRLPGLDRVVLESK